MVSAYENIIQDNLQIALDRDPEAFCRATGATQRGDGFGMRAFGEDCRIDNRGIWLGNRKERGVKGVLLSLYARHAAADALIETPYRAFREFPGSSPYAAAFKTHAEHPLVSRVPAIECRSPDLLRVFDGSEPSGVTGDVTMVLTPLPKIRLCYICYHADEDFPASVTCLFSRNADRFMPVDGLADVAEYTSRSVADRLDAACSTP